MLKVALFKFSLLKQLILFLTSYCCSYLFLQRRFRGHISFWTDRQTLWTWDFLYVYGPYDSSLVRPVWLTIRTNP